MLQVKVPCSAWSLMAGGGGARSFWVWPWQMGYSKGAKMSGLTVARVVQKSYLRSPLAFPHPFPLHNMPDQPKSEATLPTPRLQKSCKELSLTSVIWESRNLPRARAGITCVVEWRLFQTLALSAELFFWSLSSTEASQGLIQWCLTLYLNQWSLSHGSWIFIRHKSFIEKYLIIYFRARRVFFFFFKKEREKKEWTWTDSDYWYHIRMLSSSSKTS